jgi:hypothetical protein
MIAVLILAETNDLHDRLSANGSPKQSR